MLIKAEEWRKRTRLTAKAQDTEAVFVCCLKIHQIRCSRSEFSSVESVCWMCRQVNLKGRLEAAPASQLKSRRFSICSGLHRERMPQRAGLNDTWTSVVTSGSSALTVNPDLFHILTMLFTLELIKPHYCPAHFHLGHKESYLAACKTCFTDTSTNLEQMCFFL